MMKEIKLTQDSVMALMGIHPKDVSSYHRDTCQTVYIAALFIIAGS